MFQRLRAWLDGDRGGRVERPAPELVLVCPRKPQRWTPLRDTSDGTCAACGCAIVFNTPTPPGARLICVRCNATKG